MYNPPLANAELAVMQVLWRREYLTARQLQDELYDDAEHAQHGTVQRLLKRLEDKRFVGRDAGLGVNRFYPIMSREAYAGQQLEMLAAKLTSGSIAPLIMHLVEEHKISPAELRRLRELLDGRSEPEVGP
jgi:BlaI family transcriptional regulator, penicillinase repressor